ncbi:ankyrin, partial [Trichoderma longibrachiatum ATCC 18648]
SPLSLAAERGEAERVESLPKEPDADLNAVNDGGNTPLSRAARNGHIEIVKMMLQDKDRIDSEHYYHAFFAAAKGGHSDVLDLLLETFGLDVNAKNRRGRTPLSWAAQSGRIEEVELLLEHGADANLKDSEGKTPLWWAMMEGWVEVMKEL